MSASEQYVLGIQDGVGTMFIAGDNPHCCTYVGAAVDAKRFFSPQEAVAYRARMPWSRGGGPEQYHVFAITPAGLQLVES